MSDNLLRIIPANPNYIPDADRRQRALDLLRAMLPDADRCEADVYNELTFIDQGTNCEAVICPSCSARVAADGWWWDLTEHLMGRPIAEERVAMPCCGGTVPFTSVAFDWPAGFAHFELCAWNPRVDDNLLALEDLQTLQSVLNCELKQVRTHY